jgi:hypothetical protein
VALFYLILGILLGEQYYYTLCTAARLSHILKPPHPEESIAVAARIYHAKEGPGLCLTESHRQHHHNGVPKQHGGQSKILSDVKIGALYLYVKNMYKSELEATKPMLFATIAHLRAAEPPSNLNQLSDRFDPALNRTQLFQTIRTKPVAIDRFFTQDVKEV